MRPFKFFFALSLGVIVFLFLARLVVFALIIAALLSVLFFVGRKIKHFFYRLDWEHGPAGNHPTLNRQKPVWKDGLLLDYPTPQADYLEDIRKIKVQ